MARILGVELPSKRIEIALTYIYGIGRNRSRQILHEAKINLDTRANDLNEDDVNALRNLIERNYKVEGDLKFEVRNSIKRLIEMNCNRGIRHRRGLPVRGQRSKTNARTRKGKK